MRVVSAGPEGNRYNHPRAHTVRSINEALRSSSGEVEMRLEPARVYETDSRQFVDVEVVDGLSLTPLDGDIVSTSDGRLVTCR
jgi:hypothetical protein